MKKLYLLTELFALFILLPLVLLYFHIIKFFLPVLWVFSYICYNYLKHDKDFDKKNLSRKEAVNTKNLLQIFMIFAVGAALLGICTYYFEHGKWLSFPRTAPVLWAAIMILYPLLSVYPQEIIYRAFFFHRYKRIFNSERISLFASAAAFGFAHIIFSNYIAVTLSAVGGILFGQNYRKNKSLALVSIEHALYGCWIFTIGLGWYFFHGAR